MDRTGRKRLGEILVAENMISPEQLQRALAEQKTSDRRERLGDTIVRLNLTTETDIAEALGKQLDLEVVDFNEVEPSPAALELVPRGLADRHSAVPLRIEAGDVLVVAVTDPTNVVALDDLKLTSRMHGIRPVVATPSQIRSALQRSYSSDHDAVEAVESLEADQAGSLESLADSVADVGRSGDEQPIIRLTNAILADAVRSRTSDIHIEPLADGLRVRYRVDGMLKEVMRVPKVAASSLVSRLKIMSKLDIAERRRPQDGRAMIKVDGQEVDLRVSSMPGLHGEVIVMRLLRKGAERLMINDLGLAPDHHKTFMRSLARPQGLILITGPTGSGKTTTLYAGLATITDEVRNIITLEDPIEYELDGVNQSQMAPKIGFTFASGLRAVLRQDPDVVMVGEIRDLETAEMAMEAAFTGHLVLSTLHTNDAIATVMRLVDLGVDRFLISSSLLIVAAQRLARRICDSCAEPDTATPDDLESLGLTAEDLEDLSAVVRRGQGCNQCDKTGYSGRVGCLEVLEVTPEVRELILAGANEPQIRHVAAAQGMRSLRNDGIAKALLGQTTLDEVLRISPDDAISSETSVRRDLGPVRGLLALMRGEEAPEEPQVSAATAETAAGRAGSSRATASVLAAIDVDSSERTGLAHGSGHRNGHANGNGSGHAGGNGTTQPASGAAGTAAKLDPALATDPVAAVLAGSRVLVVAGEDAAAVLAEAFADQHVRIAHSGEAAREAASQVAWDAVVVDQALPDGTGTEFVERLRRLDTLPSGSVIMLTSDEDPALEVEAMIAGADDFMARPFEAADVRQRVATLLRRRTRA